jgi:hypothetical protein
MNYKDEKEWAIKELQDKVLEDMHGVMYYNFSEKRIIRTVVRLTYQYIKNEQAIDVEEIWKDELQR